MCFSNVSLICLFLSLTAGEECKFEHSYVCGIEDCNCRYVDENGGGLSILYEKFMAMFSKNNKVDKVCDKCDVFCRK